MSRLLSALKRIDDGGEKQPAKGASAAPATVAFVERRAAPQQVATLAEELPEAAEPAATSVHADAWPGGATSGPDVLALPPAEPVAPPRPTRSANPGRRATDRCRIAPEYAAISKNILDRVSKTRPTSILIVPATEEVDAGLLVAELSLAIADALDLPIVAVDADLYRNNDDAENEVATAGLADVLLDGVDWRSVLSPARDQRVQLLSAGRPLSGSDSLASGATRLSPIVAEMKTRYRALVMHVGAPTNPLCNSLVQASDLIYLVIRLGLTTQRDARAAKRQLQRGGAAVHGSIVVAN